MSDQIKVCIAGIQGYTGKMLAKLVALHPFLELTSILVKDTNLGCDSRMNLHCNKKHVLIEELFTVNGIGTLCKIVKNMECQLEETV